MLTLPIKRKWFDMILEGEKLEEYRDITPYYDKRFTNAPRVYIDNGTPYFNVQLRAGYRKDSPSIVILCWLDTGKGNPDWGAEPDKEYFRLHIVERRVMYRKAVKLDE